MASTAEGVDDPSGNQRGAAGEGEPVSFRERSDDRTDVLLQATQHATMTPRRAAPRAIAPTRGERGAATQVLAQVDELREHDIEADVVVGPFGDYLLVDACPVGSIRKVIATGRTTPANPEGANR
jgi:hypothetical protein